MGMADIGDKDITLREAVVEGVVILSSKALLAVKRGKISKGDVLEAAKLAGIFAAKRTSSLIPLCHPIPIDYVDIGFSLARDRIKIRTMVRGRTRTGVEMEAFTATAVAALTIYDMCKALNREAEISAIRLIKKTGGKSGVYERK